MELGPVNDYNGVEQYSYALVTDTRGLSLFVLARDYDEFAIEYEDYVLARLDEIGFNQRLNTPVRENHGPQCAYPF